MYLSKVGKTNSYSIMFFLKKVVVIIQAHFLKKKAKSNGSQQKDS